MPSPKIEVRAPEALLAAIDAEAERNGRTRSAEVLATLARQYLEEAAPEPEPRTAAPRAERAKAAAQAAEAKTGVEVKVGVSMGAAMERAGIATWGEPRAPYQKKGQGAHVKRR